VRLSALIANFESGAHALACARSLGNEWRRTGRAAGELEIVVCDDASSGDQNEWLARLQSEGCRVLRRSERGGYAAAIGSALAVTRGGPDDVVAVLNADLLFLPGSLGPCLAALAANPQLGAVAPRTFADPLCALEMPPQELPTPSGELAAWIAAADPQRAREQAERRTRAALAFWSARGLRAADMLSGACLFLRRHWIERLGTLLDVRFPLYFEDTDLCRRLSALGADLAHCCEADVVHFWARSTGVGADFEARAAQRFHASRRLYFERWHAGASLPSSESFANGAPPVRLHDYADLGELDAPPRLELARSASFLIEVGLAPNLGLAAGALGRGPGWQLPAASWEWLHGARYFARALERDTLELLGAWTFLKTAAARSDAHALVPRRPAHLEVTDGQIHAA
jgi:GT2 family glycosyltransferase